MRDVGRAATRVHELVKAVKGFTFMDHAAAPEAVDLRRSVGDTVRVLASKAKARAATLTVAIPDDVPSVRAVGGELNQVWMNLLDNALDAIAEGGHVSVEARVAGRNVAVEVIDDGSGIPDDLRSRIFDPFFTTKQVGKGTGLGLDITRQLVERNAGQIDVESAPGRTVFRVTLPAGDDSAVSAAPPSGAT
jgi:signal transduction histidine kinase